MARHEDGLTQGRKALHPRERTIGGHCCQGVKPGPEVDEARDASLREPSEYKQGDEAEGMQASPKQCASGQRRQELRGSDLVPVPEKGVRVHPAPVNKETPGGQAATVAMLRGTRTGLCRCDAQGGSHRRIALSDQSETHRMIAPLNPQASPSQTLSELSYRLQSFGDSLMVLSQRRHEAIPSFSFPCP